MSRLSLSFISVVCLFAIGFSGCGGNSTPHKQELDIDGNQIEPDYSSFSLYLKTKKEFKLNLNVTTNYEYDSNGYLIKSTKSDSSNSDTTINEYRYFEDYKVLKVYEDDSLVKLATFAPKQGNLDYNAATSSRLSLTSQKQYIHYAFDSVIYHSNLQIKSVITDMKFGLNYADVFNYDLNSLGFLTKIQNGRYILSSDVQSELESDTNTSFLLQDSAAIMPFTVAQAQNYLYKDNTLKTIQFDNHDDGDIEVSHDVNISYYSSGIIQHINMSAGDSWEYNADGILISSKTASGVSRVYTYSDDYKTVKMTDVNGAVVKQYIFDEIEGN